jgi:hypothetical protein
MPEESVRDLVRHIRAVLQNKGPLGTFLLSELDASISRGVDELPPNFGIERPGVEQFIGRRIATNEELLGIVVSTLETYLLTLPAVVNSLSSYLREHYKVQKIEVTLDPSLLGEEQQQTGRASIDAITPRLEDEKALAAIRELMEVVSEDEL